MNADMILKVQQKQRLFIYDAKEMGILLILGVLVAIFAFTLGVHLGKRVAPKAEAEAPVVGMAATEDEKIPGGQDLADQHKGAVESTDQLLDKAAQEELDETGLRMAVPKQVDLPRQTRAEKVRRQAPAKPVNSSAGLEDVSLNAISAIRRAAPEGKYTLQIGSHQRIETAREQIAQAEGLGVQPYLRVVELQGRGRWYRLFFGGFATRDAAERAGREYQSKGLIDSYVVANAVK